MKNFVRKNTTAIAFLFLGILISQAITYTLAHGGDINLIHGCVKNISGLLRIVGANDNCGPAETALDWNIQGVQGPPGPGGSGNSIFMCGGCDFNSNLGTPWSGKNYKNSIINSSTFSAEQDEWNNTQTPLDMSRINLESSFITNTNFSGVNVNNSNFKNVTGSLFIAETNLNNSNFANSNIKDGQIINSSFINSSFITATLKMRQFTFVNFSLSDFTNSKIQEVEIINSNFTSAIGLNSATLNNVTWSNTICPDGTNSDNNGGTCIGHF